MKEWPHASAVGEQTRSRHRPGDDFAGAALACEEANRVETVLIRLFKSNAVINRNKVDQ
jgi:hypothetical protein